MMRIRSLSPVGGLVLGLVGLALAGPCVAPALAAPPTVAGPAAAGLDAFRARHGQDWQLSLDGGSGRPRRLVGGSAPMVAIDGKPAGTLAETASLTRAFLASHAALLGLEPKALRVSEEGTIALDGARLQVVAFDVAPHGVPVLGARVVAVISHGRLVGVHAIGTAPVATDPVPRVAPARALVAALAAATMEPEDIEAPDPPRLVFVPVPAGPARKHDLPARGHDLAWRVELIAREGPRRLVALIDAHDGSLISLKDETVSACSPPAVPPVRRVVGGVRTERADAAEREELLPFATVGAAVAGRDGTFLAATWPYDGTLAGPAGNADCVGCSAPVQPLAPAGIDGDVDFGSGGADQLGNGLATPADRAAFFHVEGARRLSGRWLDVSFTRAPVRIHSNLDASCNAYWDGRSVNFFRSSGSCANTGEVRDVVAHEWGHGLDQFDGQPSSPLDVDGATGEAVADTVALLRSRDPCIGESFNVGGFGPSDTCTGVRDVDELAPGHELGSPATLTTANVVGRCPPSAFYRGPLGREGHCESQVLSQAIWHLVQDLRTGRSYSDGSLLGSESLSEDQAWEVAERLFYLSRPLLASYAPSHLQPIGMSAHEAFLLADDEGDGVASGTPHAAAIQDAFGHHGLRELGLLPPDTPDCVPPPDPAVSVIARGDDASGLPALVVSWSDVGAARHEIVRADDADDAFLLLGVAGPGAGMLVDRGVLPGRTYRYRVVAASPSGCRSASALAATGRPGAMLRIAAARIADPLPGGNGDGQLGEGEVADVLLDLANTGTADARNVRVTLAASDPALVVLGPPSMAYGTIASGGTATAPAAFRVSVGAAQRFSWLVASAETDDGCLRDAVAIEVRARDVQVESWRIDDPPPGGDADGAWRSGETVRLVVSLRDDGLLDASAVDGTIAFDGPPPAGITIVDAVATWPALPAGAPAQESDAPHFALRAAAGLPPRTRVPLTLTVRLGGLPHRTHRLALTVGAFPPALHEWALTVPVGADDSWSTPVVVPLEDTDGDGAVTACDVPAIVTLAGTLTGASGVHAVSGDGGALLWSFETTDECEDDTLSCTLPQGAIAAGDIDGDGRNEIIVSSTRREVTALTADGDVLWSTPDARVSGLAAVQIADVDADGRPEVLVGASILDGATGAVRRTLPGYSDGRIIVADLDLDGLPEIILDDGGDGTAFHADGTPAGVSFPGFERFGGAANLDADPFPEIVYVHDQTLTVRNHDGSLVFERTDVPTPIAASSPCMGDVDGDGRAEVIVPAADDLRAYDADGSLLWTAPLRDVSGMFGSCAVFDFDGDARPEVVYRGMDDLGIVDGRDGEVLWRIAASSSTLWEGPVVADVDGDGSAEILANFTRVGTWSDPQTLHVYGNPLWLPARAIWNQEAYAITNVEDSGTIPRLPTPPWLAANVYKGQSANGPCACLEPGPSFTFRVPDCAGTLFCFAGDPATAPDDMSWDFGDGSPAVVGDAPCHDFPGPGEYPVRLTLGGMLGCPRETGRFVSVQTDLAVDFDVRPACAGRDTCVSTLARGGVPPLERAWDFGDGSPLVVADFTCHAYASGGPFTITHLVRDANGCLAEATQVVDIVDPGALPEISPPGSASPLLVSKNPAGLLLRYEATPHAVGVYRGKIQTLRPLGYSHDANACRLVGSSTTLPLPREDSYYLVVAAACENPREDGPYGRDSFGAVRPSARALGRAQCP